MDLNPDSSMLSNRPLRFILSGIVNTIFGFSVFGFLFWIKLPIWASLLLSNIAGIAFNFLTFGGYVFRDLHIKRLPRFIGAYLFIYIVNLGFLSIANEFHIHAMLAQMLLLAPLAILSYLVMKNFVFKTKPNEKISFKKYKSFRK